MSRKIILIKQELLLLVYELNRSGLLAENEKIRPILAQLEKLLLCDLSPSTNDSFFFLSRRRHTRSLCDWSSDVCSSDLFETRWHFNSAIALIMELTNGIYLQEPLEEGVRQEVRKELLELLTLMLAPMTPHLAEELWEMLGHTGGLWTAGWRAFDEALTREDEVEIPVQVNGRLRGKVKVAVGTSGDEVEKLARADAVIAPHLAGKSIVKRIFVPDKLLNLVVA